MKVCQIFSYLLFNIDSGVHQDHLNKVVLTSTQAKVRVYPCKPNFSPHNVRIARVLISWACTTNGWNGKVSSLNSYSNNCSQLKVNGSYVEGIQQTTSWASLQKTAAISLLSPFQPSLKQSMNCLRYQLTAVRLAHQVK